MAHKLPRDEVRFRQVWDGDSETDCVDICRDLPPAVGRFGIRSRLLDLPGKRITVKVVLAPLMPVMRRIRLSLLKRQA